MNVRAALLVALLPLASLTGCLGGDEGPTVEPQTNESGDEYVVPETLPDGREFVAGQEFNETEEGAGGVDHKHDYWAGRESVVIYDRDVPISLQFERDDQTKVFTAFINLDKVPETDIDALVYEGTGKIVFTITEAPAWASTYQISFRTAATDWTSWEPIAVGTALEYAPTNLETDMPHSFRSLWNWKLQATATAPVTGNPFDFCVADGVCAEAPLHVKIEVLRAKGVEDWPGHPVFFEDGKPVVVADNKPGKANVQGAPDVLLYGIEPDQVVPDKLISMGAKHLDVWMNVSSLTMPPGIEPSSFQLQWRNASTPPNSLGNNDLNNATDGKTWAHWRLDLHESGVDSPYQPTSRFTFKVLVNPANSDAVLCYRCVPYEFSYTLTVIAWGAPVEIGAEMPA